MAFHFSRVIRSFCVHVFHLCSIRMQAKMRLFHAITFLHSSFGHGPVILITNSIYLLSELLFITNFMAINGRLIANIRGHIPLITQFSNCNVLLNREEKVTNITGSVGESVDLCVLSGLINWKIYRDVLHEPINQWAVTLNRHHRWRI